MLENSIQSGSPTPWRDPGGVFLLDYADCLSPSMLHCFRGLAGIERFHSTDEFFEADYPERTGCVVLMTQARGLTPLAPLEQLRRAAYRLPVVVIAEQVDIRFAVQAVKAGASDVLDMSLSQDLVLDSLEKAMEERVRPTSSQPRLVSDFDRQAAMASVSSLTSRQSAILSRIMLGQPNKNIAADLGISQRTAENHRAALMKKLGVSSISALIRVAIAAA